MSLIGDKQEQKVGDGAVAVQISGDVNYQEGISPDEVRQIASLAVKAEFYQLSQMAADIAGGRAQRVCDDFLAKLEAENPDGLKKANDPDFQYTLFAAQKAFAKTGNEDLEPLLVDLLVRRTKEESQNLRQIVLAESIDVLSKITAGQISALTIVFVLRRTQNFGVHSLDNFLSYCDRHIGPFLENMATGPATYRHLQYANCGSVEIMQTELHSVVSQSYPGALQSGFDSTEPDVLALSPAGKVFIVPSEYVEGKFQVLGKDEKAVRELCERNNAPQQDAEILVRLIKRPPVSAEAFYDKLRGSRGYWSGFIQDWNSSEAKGFSLTSVGIAIAHASLMRYVPDFADLSTWIE